MRKWMKRAALEIRRHPRPGVATEVEVAHTALHMRLRERKRREFWRRRDRIERAIEEAGRSGSDPLMAALEAGARPDELDLRVVAHG